MPLARLGPSVKEHKRASPVTRTTDLTIEAFPGSGNTFALGLFQATQSENLKIAHHIHAAAQVIASVRWNIPCLVIIRKPDDAVLSFVSRGQVIIFRQALREYCKFHKTILPYQHGFIVVTFEQVLDDFKSVVTQLNNKFNTNFVVPHTMNALDTKQKALSKARSWHSYIENKKGLPIYESDVPLPSKEREIHKQLLQKHLEDSQLIRLRKEAEQIYMSYTKFIQR